MDHNNINSKSSKLQNMFKLLIDSGASHYLINNKALFTSFHPWNGSHIVTLADGTSQAPIIGSGTIEGFTTSGHRFRLDDCLLVPSLASSLLSTKAFTKSNQHYIHTEFGITTISTPTYTISTDDKFHDPLVFMFLSTQIPTIHANHNIPPRRPQHTTSDPSPETIPTDIPVSP